MNYHEAMTEVRAGRIRPVYLIYGEEEFLKEELYHAIREALVRPETADFNYHVFDTAPDQIAQALAMAQTQPFFAERRLVVVKDAPVFAASRKKGDDAEGGEEEKGGHADEQIMAYVKEPAPSTCLLFLSGGIDSRRKVTKAVVTAGAAVECQPLRADDAIMWAQQRCQSKGKRMGSAAAHLLVEKVGTDLRLMDAELEKLVLYVGAAREVAPADVETLVSNLAETEVYRLTEAVMLKQRAKAMLLLQQTLRQVDHPLQLLAAITSRFRQMLTVKALVARGLSKKEGASIAKMHPYAYEKMTGHVAHIPRNEIAAAFRRLLEADLAMKSGFDPRLTLETLVAELLGGE